MSFPNQCKELQRRNLILVEIVPYTPITRFVFVTQVKSNQIKPNPPSHAVKVMLAQIVEKGKRSFSFEPCSQSPARFCFFPPRKARRSSPALGSSEPVASLGSLGERTGALQSGGVKEEKRDKWRKRIGKNGGAWSRTMEQTCGLLCKIKVSE